MARTTEAGSPTTPTSTGSSRSAPPVAPALAAIEAAAEPLGIPIVDRDCGRVLSVLAGGRRRIVEVGTAYGYSTLWMALGQPADGTIVTIDPDRERTDLARGWWREAGIADERITVVNAPALEAFAAGDPALAGPFDMVFIDALKPEYRGVPRGARRPARARRARGRRQRPVERPRLGLPAGRGRRRQHRGAARVRRRRPRRPALHGDDPAARRRPAHRLVARLTGAGTAVAAIRVRVRLFAVQRELAGTREVALELRRRRRRRGRLGRARRAASRCWRPGRPSVRFARNGAYADAGDGARRTATRSR